MPASAKGASCNPGAPRLRPAPSGPGCPPHDAPDQAREDRARTRALIEAGYIVLRFRHADASPALFRRHPDLLGFVPNE